MSRRPLQQTFEGITKIKDVFGGSRLKSHPKTKRPLDSKFATHIVLRANKGGMRRPGILHLVNEQIRTSCRRHGVRLYEFANVGNHLHLLIKLPNRRSWNAFIRELTGRIAQQVEKEPGTAFWKHRPFTRIVRGWKKAYQTAKEYVRLNILEAEGRINRRDTKTLKDLRMIWAES